jgi:hypothetical protein
MLLTTFTFYGYTFFFFLSRALKTKGNTPKYGLIYHASHIGKAATQNKGRISRYLANKCAIASRIDCFSGKPSCSTMGNERFVLNSIDETNRYSYEYLWRAYEAASVRSIEIL